MNFRKALPAIAAVGLTVGLAMAVLAQTIAIPQVVSIGPNDLIQVVPNGQPTAQSQYAPAPLLGNYAATLPGNNAENVLIGADFGVNLFQDGTSVSSITTTPTYVADQWAAFSGTATTLAGTQQTGASDITAGYTASLRITRSGAGVLQSCVVQEISSAASTRFQGQTAEIDFHDKAGAGFSAANSILNVIVVTGTGTDEGLTNLAHSINSALGGSNWTGVATITVPVTINSAWNRYSVAVPIPLTATEIGVALCWTPVGGSPSNDWHEFTGAQMVRNSALTTLAGTTGVALAPNDPRAKAYLRDALIVEQLRQYTFYYRISEGAAITARGLCRSRSVTTCSWNIKFPTPMFKVPTMSYTAGFAAETTVAGGTLGACSSLAADTTVASTVASIFEAYALCTATTIPAAGTVDQIYDNGGAGVVKANARF